MLYAFQAQKGKPLHQASSNNPNLKKEKTSINSSLLSIPRAERTILNTTNYQSLPPLLKRLSNNPDLKVVQTSENGLPIMIKGNLRSASNGRDMALQTFDYLNAIKSAIKIRTPEKEFAIIERKNR